MRHDKFIVQKSGYYWKENGINWKVWKV